MRIWIADLRVGQGTNVMTGIEQTRRCWPARPPTLAGGPALAAAPKAVAQGPGVYRHKLGDYQLTALYDGLWSLKIDDKFVRNASGADGQQGARGRVPAAEHPAGFIHRAAGQHRLEARPDRRRHRRPDRRHRGLHDGQPRRRRRRSPRRSTPSSSRISIPTISTASRPRTATRFSPMPKSWCRSRNGPTGWTTPR